MSGDLLELLLGRDPLGLSATPRVHARTPGPALLPASSTIGLGSAISSTSIKARESGG